MQHNNVNAVTVYDGIFFHNEHYGIEATEISEY